MISETRLEKAIHSIHLSFSLRQLYLSDVLSPHLESQQL